MMSMTSKQQLLRLTGYLFFLIGLAGTVLPLLPTTIFWVVAAICFAKSAPAMYRRILAWPGFGPAIAAYLEHGVIGPRGKLFSIAGMGFGAIVIVASPLGPYTVAISLIGIAVAAAYVLTRPSAAAEAKRS